MQCAIASYYTRSTKRIYERMLIMMINNNYALAVTQAKSANSSFVNFDKTTPAIQAIPGQKDTVTLSDKALAMMNGEVAKEEKTPTYINPETASSLLAKSKSTDDTTGNKAPVDNRFGEMMQKIVDQRLGVDRKKLEEIDALMEEIAKNENMSPEEKQKALEELTKIREKIIEESLEIQKVAKQTDPELTEPL